ncbi:MAG: HEAT repeat domain-containing protein [Candidatus Kariarchaeaceae archaeon]|jgi:HEAT repeat protein
MDDNIPAELKMTVSRLYSQDANDRVKAAGELGEIGTPEVAEILLKVAYEDEASTVRQMAIQSYGEILSTKATQELVKAVSSHYDEYVQMYALNSLGNIGGEGAAETMLRNLEHPNPRMQATTLRAMIHSETKEYAPDVFEFLKDTTDSLLQRNCIEALALWKYKPAKAYISDTYFENRELNDLELKTISAFYLAVMGEKKGKNFLKNERVDNYMRIAVNDKHYRGGTGLLEAADRIS